MTPFWCICVTAQATVCLISWLSPLGKGQGPSNEHIWIHSTKDALCQVCYWSSGSGEEDENVKSLQHILTSYNKKSSLELLPHVNQNYPVLLKSCICTGIH